MLRSFCYCDRCCQPITLHHPCHSLDFSQNLLLSNMAIICGPPRGSFAAQYEDPLRSCVHHQAPNCQRSNAHVKSGLVKGRNGLYIRFLVPARILYMWAPLPNKEDRAHGQSQTNEWRSSQRKYCIGRKTDGGRGGWGPSTAHHWVPKWCWLGKRIDLRKKERIKAKKSFEGIESP